MIAAKTVLAPSEPLMMTVGRVHQFKDCPRKFFYAGLLHLPGKPSDAADFGNFVHTLMEVFHRLPIAEQTPTQLRNLLSEALSESPRDPARWQAHAKSLGWFDQLPALLKLDRSRQLRLAIEDLIGKGLPSQYASIVLPELEATWSLPEQNTSFRLRLDLLFQEAASQQWHVVDYKVYGPRQFEAKSMDTLIRRLAHVLNGLPAEATDHRTRFLETASKPLLYQMPLYWLAGQTLPEINGKLGSFSLQIIRPPLTEPHQGSCRISVSCDEVESNLDKVIEDLLTHVIGIIRQTSYFQPEPDRMICQTCDYRAVCPQ